MKNLAVAVSLAAISLGFSSCCSMFGNPSYSAGYRDETRQVKTCDYDIVTEQVVTPGSTKSGKGGMVQTIEKKVPRYKTVTVRTRNSGGGKCVRLYCPKKDRCGTTSESTMRIASVQGSVGSPNLGLIPTMRELPLATKTANP